MPVVADSVGAGHAPGPVALRATGPTRRVNGGRPRVIVGLERPVLRGPGSPPAPAANAPEGVDWNKNRFLPRLGPLIEVPVLVALVLVALWLRRRLRRPSAHPLARARDD